MKIASSLLLGMGLCFSSPLIAGDWLTFAHDPQRSGWAFEEKTLSHENVSGLELKWKTQLKNDPRALTALTAPLVASEVPTAQGIKTLVYVAGSANNFFAVDAENGSLVWSRNFESYVLPKNEDHWLCPQGINATPTIDRSTGTVYTIAADGKLIGLDLSTGKTKFGPIQFVPPYSKNWSLNLVDGVVYTALSQGCGGGQSGFYAMEIREPFRPVVHNLLISDKGGAGIWGRGGPVIGENGRIYSTTGDGEFEPLSGKYGSTVIASSLRNMHVVDYYSPNNWRDVNRFDWDMSCTSPVWFAYKNYHLIAVGGKEGIVYLLDADSLGDKDHHTAL